MTRRALAALAALLPVAALAGCGAFVDAPQDESISVPVTRADVELFVPAEGELTALKASPIAVPRVPTGALKVSEVTAEGSLVAKGDIVVVFDGTKLNIDLDNHRASFRSADRHIDRTGYQARIEAGAIEVMKRVAELELDNAVAFPIVDDTIYSRQEILETEVRRDDAAETILFADASLLLRGEYYQIEQSILDVEKRQAGEKMERTEYSLGQLVLHAPIGGLVVYKKNWRGAAVAVGDTLWPGNVVMSIVDPASTALDAFVLEKDAASIEVGASATVTVDARPDRRFEGKVTMIADVSRPVERGSPVKYTAVQIELLDGDPTLLKPGMKSEAHIRTGTLENAVVVPRAAIRGEGDAPYVLVAGDAGVERRSVKLGPGDQARVGVSEGLSEGERVLVGEAPAVIEPRAATDVSARAGS